MSDLSDLGIRMKRYEGVSTKLLPRRIPVIIRLDGKAFHTLTRKYYNKGFSEEFTKDMITTAEHLVKNIQGCSFCYSQSDEISLLLTDYQTIRTEPWFGYSVNKVVSISSALASSRFSRILNDSVLFDCRAFSVPQDEVCNYFIWRQNDATRNAIQMAGQEYFSHKQLHGKNCNEIQEMLFTLKDINFNDYTAYRKRGWCIINNKIDLNIPIFTQEREYIEKFVYVRED